MNERALPGSDEFGWTQQ